MEARETLKITHVSGMHARASTKFVETAQQFQSNVFLSRDGVTEVDGKSVLGCLTLGVEIGHELTIRVEGSDCEECMEALLALVRRNFDGV